MSKPTIITPQRMRVPPWRAIDLEYLRPIAEWYRYMSEDDLRKLPIRVLNALDSLDTMMGKSRSYFDD